MDRTFPCAYLHGKTHLLLLNVHYICSNRWLKKELHKAYRPAYKLTCHLVNGSLYVCDLLYSGNFEGETPYQTPPYTHCRSHTHIHTLSYTHSLTLTYTHTLSHSHTHALSLTHTHILSLTYTHTLSLCLSS